MVAKRRHGLTDTIDICTQWLHNLADKMRTFAGGRGLGGH